MVYHQYQIAQLFSRIDVLTQLNNIRQNLTQLDNNIQNQDAIDRTCKEIESLESEIIANSPDTNVFIISV